MVLLTVNVTIKMLYGRVICHILNLQVNLQELVPFRQFSVLRIIQ